MIWQIILLSIVMESKGAGKEKGWSLVGSPLAFVYPCKGNEDISLSYEPGKPPGEENEYHVHITEKFPKHSRVNIKFDAEAAVTLTNNASARISSESGQFSIRFFAPADYLNFNVKGPTNGVMPYMTSITVNNVEYCEDPGTGYLDAYVLGSQDTAEVQLSVPDSKCGRRKVQHTELITNGLATKPGDWPWHAAIYRSEKATIKYTCGGTLLSKTFVLTAAHCASIQGAPLLPETLNVVLGKYNLIGGDLTAQEREVHEIILHEDFAYQRLNNDIALLKLKTEAKYDDYIQPACLWFRDVLKKLPSPQNIYGTVVGWGFDETDSLSYQIKQAYIPKITDSTCIKSNPLFYGNMLAAGNKFCAGYNNGTSACNGDSGGGFTVFAPDSSGNTSPSAQGAWYIRGIVSLTISRRDVRLCDPTQYVLFTDVAKYRGWLKKRVPGL